MSTTREQRVPRGFTETNLYLVPAPKSEALRPRLASQRVVTHLQDLGILAGVYDSRLGWLAAGRRASDLFRLGADGAGFEYLIVYEGPTAQFVPDAHTGAFGAVCKRCGSRLDDALRSLLQDERCQSDARERTLSCEACGMTRRLDELACRLDTALTCFYLNFCNVSSVELAPRVLTDLEQLVGAKLRVLLERL